MASWVLRVDDQAFRTDTGRQRSENEVSLFVRAPIFVVADGMGGAQAGEVASKAAADAFDRDLPEGPPERFLRETIEDANRRIHDLAGFDIERAVVEIALHDVAVDVTLVQQAGAVGTQVVGDIKLAAEIEHGERKPFLLDPDGLAFGNFIDATEFYFCGHDALAANAERV